MWMGPMTAAASGGSPVVGVLKPRKPSNATTSRPLRQASGRAQGPGLGRLPGAVFDHVQQT
jgi:hypothetical protein